VQIHPLFSAFISVSQDSLPFSFTSHIYLVIVITVQGVAK